MANDISRSTAYFSGEQSLFRVRLHHWSARFQLHPFLFFFFKGYFILFYFIHSVFLGPHSQHMEVPRLGVKSEL